MSKPIKAFAFVLIGAFFVFCPLFMDILWVRTMTEVVYYALFAVSLNMIIGYGGMLSFGHAAYFGVGAYSTALALKHIGGLGLLSSIAVGGAAAALIGAFLSLFLIRVSGTYFAMLTLAFGELLHAVALKWRDLTGGDDGLGSFPKPDLSIPLVGKIDMIDTNNFYWFTLVVVGVMLFLAWHLTRTALGSSIVLLRENEERARFLGHRTSLTRFWLFTISAFLAGVAGSMFALFQEFVSTGSIDILKSTEVILMVVLGGVGSFAGPILGSTFFVVVANWLSGVTEYWELIIGVFFIFMVLFFRWGFAGIVHMVWSKIINPRNRASVGSA